jgi:hypothetical protein
MLSNRLSIRFLVIVPFLAFSASSHGAEFLTYHATTGQSATAQFTFRDATHLEIKVTDTTAGDMAGSSGILTNIGVRLPDSAVFSRNGSTVTIGTASSSSGFSTGVFQSGADVSGEWGFSGKGKADLGSAGKYDQLSTLQAKGIKQFKGANRDGKKALAGAQGGVSRSTKSGMGVVNNSINMLLTIDANARKKGVQALSSAQQAAFLTSLFSNSVLQFGAGEAFAYAVTSVEDSSDTLDGTTETPGPSDGIPTIDDLNNGTAGLPNTDFTPSTSPGSVADQTPLDTDFGYLDTPGFEAAVSANPEPSSICLLAIGTIAMAGYRFRVAGRRSS